MLVGPVLAGIAFLALDKIPSGRYRQQLPPGNGYAEYFKIEGKKDIAGNIKDMLRGEAVTLYIPRPKPLIDILSDNLLAVDRQNTRNHHLNEHYAAVRDNNFELAEYLRNFYGLTNEELIANLDRVRYHRKEYSRLMNNFLSHYRPDDALHWLREINENGDSSDPNIGTLVFAIKNGMAQGNYTSNPIGLASLKIGEGNLSEGIYDEIVNQVQEISTSDAIQTGIISQGVKLLQERGKYEDLAGNKNLNDAILRRFEDFVYYLEHNKHPIDWVDYESIAELWDISPEVERLRPGSLDYLIALTLSLNSRWDPSYVDAWGDKNHESPPVFLFKKFYPDKIDKLLPLSQKLFKQK